MKWKDIFFFNKKDKISIIILSCLGVFLLVGYSAYPYIRNYKNNTDKHLEEFAQFQKGLKPVYSSNKIESNKETEKNLKPSEKGKLQEGQTIDINSANEKALKKIPGIGDTFAKRIVEYRSALGGFSDIEQLQEIRGVSAKKFEEISSFVVLEKQIKKCSLAELIKKEHPYINADQIISINNHIKEGKQIASVEVLQSLEHFTPRDIDRIKEYIHFK